LPPEGTYGPDRKNVSELAPRRTEGTYGKCLKYCIPATLMGYHKYFGFAYLSGTGMQYFLLLRRTHQLKYVKTQLLEVSSFLSMILSDCINMP